ncbi:hypothetical protein IPdc08_00066 [archaeon]|nr:hypothetical protein IPdc08_00066 [archaeon]
MATAYPSAFPIRNTTGGVKAHEWARGYIRLAATEYKTYPELLELKDAVVDAKGNDLVVHGLYWEMEKAWGWFSELRRILRL